jgi:hypothetical protein
MPTAKKTASTPKASATKAAVSAKPKTVAKKATTSTAVAKKTPVATVVSKPVAPKKPAASKKATVEKKAASVSISRTSNPSSNTVTIKKITRNIVGFYMTEDIEIRRVTKSDNMTSEKLKAKYAQLKAKAKAKSQ